jgi:hypothetical protein
VYECMVNFMPFTFFFIIIHLVSSIIKFNLRVENTHRCCYSVFNTPPFSHWSVSVPLFLTCVSLSHLTFVGTNLILVCEYGRMYSLLYAVLLWCLFTRATSHINIYMWSRNCTLYAMPHTLLSVFFIRNTSDMWLSSFLEAFGLISTKGNLYLFTYLFMVYLMIL